MVSLHVEWVGSYKSALQVCADGINSAILVCSTMVAVYYFCIVLVSLQTTDSIGT